MKGVKILSHRATTIAVVNQKGGTSKTTTTENLGIGLAQEGKKVLLIDTDPQASLTISLGYPRPDDLNITLSDFKTGRIYTTFSTSMLYQAITIIAAVLALI